MTHKRVQIYPNGVGGMTVLVDGVDVSGFINRDGMAIEWKDGRAYVWLPVAPVAFSGDIPEAVVNALSGTQADLLTVEAVEGWADQIHRAWRLGNWQEAVDVAADMRRMVRTGPGSTGGKSCAPGCDPRHPGHLGG